MYLTPRNTPSYLKKRECLFQTAQLNWHTIPCRNE